MIVVAASFWVLGTTATLSPASFAPTQAVAAAFTLRGAVADETGAAIAGAKVTATADSGPLTTTTDSHGAFSLVLPKGRYAVDVSAPGFRHAGVRVTASESGSERLTIVMQVEQVRESVTVSGSTGYAAPAISTATKLPIPLGDVPQSVTVITKELMRDQLMTSVGDAMRYVPGVAVHQGENNRDQVIIRGNSSSADFFVDGVRDDVQYYRDVYNLSRVEVFKGSNALTFGRGGLGGVVNRVAKQALFQSLREVSLQAGRFGNKRATADFDQPLTGSVAIRVNGMFEDSDSFRSNVGLTRYGLTPTLTFAPGNRTKIVARYEYLNDTRVADRGITSFQGRPLEVDPSTFYGNPADSHVAASVHIGSVTIERRLGPVTLRNHTSIANYDRWYQNYVPGAVSADRNHVTLTAYNNATKRRNVFNQTDTTYSFTTGALRHTLLAGVEVGSQGTDNFRNTGFFRNATTSMAVPLAETMITTPVTFRQSATDANNHLRTNLAAAYAQDHVRISSHLQLVGGLRVDRFDLRYHDNRTGIDLRRPDNLVSPRVGVVFKPLSSLSAYGSYGVTHLPSSGDQFSSLTTITQQVEPERCNNIELGVKYDVRPSLAFTTALYRLDRTHTRATDPNDPARIVQTGSQRTNGYEIGLNGLLTQAWSVAGGYAYQNAVVTSATVAAKAGAQVGQVPHHTLSLWNRYQFHPRLAGGIGIQYRSEMFAAVDNTVTLPGYVRVDGAAYFNVNRQLRLQANLENVFDRRYYINADGNTNISPGFPRTLRLGLTVGF